MVQKNKQKNKRYNIYSEVLSSDALNAVGIRIANAAIRTTSTIDIKRDLFWYTVSAWFMGFGKKLRTKNGILQINN
jgi:hypothetical protein